MICGLSGGVDSSVLLAVAASTLGSDAVTAVTAASETYTPAELERAVAVAETLGVAHVVVRTTELDDERFVANPPDRCYGCKAHMLDAVAAVASAVLTNRVDRVVREQYGDSYSPYAVTWADRDPDPVVLTYVSATGAPERIEAIGMTVVDQLRQLADGDFSDAELAAATAPVVEQYQYVDNGQFLTELIRLALDPDYDVDEYVYEDATEVDRAAVAEWLATHVDIDQYVAVVTTPRS